MLSDGEDLANFWWVPDSEEDTIKDFTGQQNKCSIARKTSIYFIHMVPDDIILFAISQPFKTGFSTKCLAPCQDTVYLSSLWNHNHT